MLARSGRPGSHRPRLDCRPRHLLTRRPALQCTLRPGECPLLQHDFSPFLLSPLIFFYFSSLQVLPFVILGLGMDGLFLFTTCNACVLSRSMEANQKVRPPDLCILLKLSSRAITQTPDLLCIVYRGDSIIRHLFTTPLTRYSGLEGFLVAMTKERKGFAFFILLGR